ncbi:MAG: neutral/alkaline non-lysosomal ceramidase N-terminal domain-containing protein, partial [Candidatus Bathyarchaeia archaeon]
FLGGYGSWPEPATYVHDDLYARSIVLSSGRKTIVLAVLDIVGLFWDQVELIRDEVEGLYGIDRDYVIVATTHSHASPDTLGLWTYYPAGVNDAYMEYVRNRTVESIGEALENMNRARIRFASGEVPGVMENARDQEEKYAVTYPELEVMKVEAVKKKETIAVLINFAGHPEVLGGDNRDVSTDYVQYLIRDVEGEFGGVASFFNGALGGMITPNVTASTYEECERIGSTIASATIEALEDAEVSRDTRISVEKEILTIPLENPLFYGAMLMELLDRPDYNPAIGYLGAITSEVNVIKIGEAQMITLPGEALPSVGHRLKEAMTGEYNFVIGLGNDEIGYIIPQDEWDWNGTWVDADWTGKYEESMSVGPSTAVIVESTLMKMLSEVVAVGYGEVLVEDPWYNGSATLYIAGVISLKVDGFVYDPYLPWWYVYPRPEEWKAPWVQWDIVLHWRWKGAEFYLGYNEDGYILIKIYEGQVTASGPAVSFSGVVV